MQTILAIILFFSGLFFIWFGYVVESGKKRPDPFDTYFPLPIRGFNIDYMLGVAGMAIGVGLLFLSVAILTSQSTLAIIGAVLFLVGIIRSLLPPDWAGPHWIRRARKK